MTVVIKNQSELEALMVYGEIIIDENLVIKCDIDLKANIKARNIEAYNIKAWNIEARDIKAWDIKADDIVAHNIEARNIEAENIKAENIFYYAVCFAYCDIICTSIEGTRKNSRQFCLDGEITIKPKEKKSVTLDVTDEQWEEIKNIINLK